MVLGLPAPFPPDSRSLFVSVYRGFQEYASCKKQHKIIGRNPSNLSKKNETILLLIIILQAWKWRNPGTNIRTTPLWLNSGAAQPNHERHQ
ncbi:hypothetical protein BC349_09750 [Flavihumibacter stibioxidans]|uniref:Uncharacterized protein n=1 Tax=Flavihumibacter stibioxidans TaxID=1834163 RepID=A0ABR7M8F2_9BACT|nr:hypothetical protein [Flavihumibacter stibioxidans]